MIEFFKKFEWSPKNIMKSLALFILAIIVLSIAFYFLKVVSVPVLRGINQTVGLNRGPFSESATDYARGGGSSDGMMIPDYDSSVSDKPEFSYRNASIVTEPTTVAGNDAEDFEVTEYSAEIETLDKGETCKEILKLKSLDYVVFQSSNEYTLGCNYVFKVKHNNVEEILNLIKSLDPRDISESIYTIKRELDDFTSRTEILEKKLETINKTLNDAIKTYEEVTAVASRAQNIDALGKIIDSKINLIERLTNERINVASQIEMLGRAKAEQLDRLEYTYFRVNVYENKFVDFENIKSSWKESVRIFVRDVNNTVQNITIGLLGVLVVLIQYIIYFLILLFIVKFLWKVTKNIWNK